MTNAIKVLLQMTSVSLQPVPSLHTYLLSQLCNCFCYYIANQNKFFFSFHGTITIIKFWTSLFCHIKKITLNHALLKLSQVSNDKILSF
jgi:hypothetical protein